jgi:putative SOS response-associated peptidase YedK
MCGRYVQKSEREELDAVFKISSEAVTDFRPNYNVAPMQNVLVVRQMEDERTLGSLRWSLLPSWSREKTLKYPTLNARGETISEKPTFKKPFERSRCIIPNDGFYEWKKIGKDKEPYLIFLKDQAPAAFAGLWDRWKDPITGEVIDSCTIITTEANDLVHPIHERMPVFLDTKDFDEWLDPTNYDTRSLQGLIKPYDSDLMSCFRVSKDVGSVKNNRPDLIDSID